MWLGSFVRSSLISVSAFFIKREKQQKKTFCMNVAVSVAVATAAVVVVVFYNLII